MAMAASKSPSSTSRMPLASSASVGGACAPAVAASAMTARTHRTRANVFIGPPGASFSLRLRHAPLAEIELERRGLTGADLELARQRLVRGMLQPQSVVA